MLRLKDKLARLPSGRGLLSGHALPTGRELDGSVSTIAASRVELVELVELVGESQIVELEAEQISHIDAETGEITMQRFARATSHTVEIEGERTSPAIGQTQTVEFEGGRVSHLRQQIALLQAKQRPPREARPPIRATAEDVFESGHSQLPGEIADTEYGPLRCVTTPYPEDHQHGSVPVALALSAHARDLSILALDPSLESVDFTRALYIDTETTGLAGGSGTIPFLVGMAWFEGRNLTVEQLLLEKPGHEAPILRRLAARLAQASCVVSYNGKSFDWPLLRTRFILNRVPAPAVPAHLDLLHCARRVYKRRLGAVRLVHLEEQVLGFVRVDDIAGEMIPQTYLGFLRGQVPASALLPIVEHNRHDLVALAAIMGELVRRFSSEHAQDARDTMGYAQVAARADDRTRAVLLAEQAAIEDIRGELAPQALFLAGQLHAKAGDFEASVARYLASIEAACGDVQQAAPAQLALAKLFERTLRDLVRAIDHARHTAPAEGEAACEKRVARLLQRMQREPVVRR